jgi:hypothetical protein
VDLLRDRVRLEQARRDARLAAERFDWLDIARRTVKEYERRLDVHRSGVATVVSA